jgi:hypothetical protein
MMHIICLSLLLQLAACVAGQHVNSKAVIRDNGIIDGLILGALNAVKDPVINPAIAQHIPDPLNVNIGKAGKADKTCIIKVFGKCICSVEADYSVSLKEIKGLKGLHVTSFTSVTDIINVSQSEMTFNVAAEIADADVDIDKGDAEAGADACKIHPKVHGSAATHARLQKATVEAKGLGRLDPINKCFQLSLSQATVKLNQVQIHDTSVDISIGKLPGMNVGKLVDLVNGLFPEITDAIDKAVAGPISNAVTHAADSGKIPCIKIPIFDDGSDSKATDFVVV